MKSWYWWFLTFFILIAASSPLWASNWFTETTTPLVGAATYTGPARDSGATPPQVSYFGCSFFADQAGTAFVEDSTDGTTWIVAVTGALVASTRLDLNAHLRARYSRCRLLNGATPETSLRIVSSYTGS